ncbi:very short patch repair endonuclease [Eilatimonas milleporae]|uniref:Very short patch repair endonuclease n=1 Tax=Eilatimonas milleporae TaxID=911205 RepID=A0A3M0CG62_9PROT|nr:DNA mismatch endonuclease Vsr [Eilatimonas milleporae]RMB07975.1 T/G mismatch-specific endonuclease [Eilatimonas milleporae]
MDTLSKRQRSERMGRIKAKDTKPEMTVRRLVHGLGYRYRLHRRDLPGNPDLVFTSRRKVIFVHGCFWHRHPDKDCKLARLPKTRLDFWLPKLEANRERDIKKQKQLRDLGWRFMIIWECQLNNLDDLLINIKGFLEAK